MENYLKALRLPALLAQYQRLALDAAQHNLSYERYLLALLQAEVQQREVRRQQALVRQARFPILKELADFDFGAVASLPKQRVLELAQGHYLEGAENLILVGNPGLGKSHLASALALAACRQGKRVRFYNVAGLVNELLAAQAEHRLSKLFIQLGRQQLLVLDEFGFIPLTPQGGQLLFQVISHLHEKVSLILTTNLRFGDWTQVLGSEQMTAALLDRLTFRATILEFVGQSWRFKQRLAREGGSGGEPPLPRPLPPPAPEDSPEE
jgi:DNA replication protein DnaC